MPLWALSSGLSSQALSQFLSSGELADCAQPGKLWPLQAGCPTASSTEAHGIYLPGKPQLLEPWGGHCPAH